MDKFLRILMSAIFVGIADVIGDSFAMASRTFELQRDESSVDYVNYSLFKGVLLSRERVATLMGISEQLSTAEFKAEFESKISNVSESAAAAVLTICQVRPMGVPVDTTLKFGFGSPVFASFVEVKRSAFQPKFYETADEVLSALGEAQKSLGLEPSDETGLQLMLSAREVVATRSMRPIRGGAGGKTAAMFSKDASLGASNEVETDVVAEGVVVDPSEVVGA